MTNISIDIPHPSVNGPTTSHTIITVPSYSAPTWFIQLIKDWYLIIEDAIHNTDTDLNPYDVLCDLKEMMWEQTIIHHDRIRESKYDDYATSYDPEDFTKAVREWETITGLTLELEI